VPSVGKPDGGLLEPPPTLVIPEIRDYQKINAELVALLASGLVGSWEATIEIIGRTGPEAVAGLDAPGLTVLACGPTADGAARGLKAGRVIVVGDAGDGAGYAQSDGLLVITGSAGHRTALAQSGGIIAVLGSVGRLASDRQSGGRLFVAGEVGPHQGRGRRGGRLLGPDAMDRLDTPDAEVWRSVAVLLSGLVPPR
jgi:glutamate synthase domain-containing protein 3